MSGTYGTCIWSCRWSRAPCLLYASGCSARSVPHRQIKPSAEASGLINNLGLPQILARGPQP